jgi:hypothetical protein
MAITPNTPRLPERFVDMDNLDTDNRYVDNLQRDTNCRPVGLTLPNDLRESLVQPPIASNYMPPQPTSNSLVPESRMTT